MYNGAYAKVYSLLTNGAYHLCSLREIILPPSPNLLLFVNNACVRVYCLLTNAAYHLRSLGRIDVTSPILLLFINNATYCLSEERCLILQFVAGDS